MTILVFGVGAIGSLMAHYLCKAGNDVTVVARSTYEELSKNGLVIRHYLQKKTTVDHPGRQMPAWDEMRNWALPVLENAYDYALQKTNEVKNNVYQ